MNALLRERPWPVHAFAAIFLGAGLYALLEGLGDPELWLANNRALAPDFPWNRDWAIVAISARFTIVCIPVVAVWGARSRIARVIVTLFTVFACANAEPEGIVRAMLLAAGCALLFLPSADRWLQGRGAGPTGDPAG